MPAVPPVMLGVLDPQVHIRGALLLVIDCQNRNSASLYTCEAKTGLRFSLITHPDKSPGICLYHARLWDVVSRGRNESFGRNLCAKKRQHPPSPASFMFKPTSFKDDKNPLVSIWAPTEVDLSSLKPASPHWAWNTHKETTRPYQRLEEPRTTKKP